MFRTELTIAPVSQPLTRTARVLTLGSCFADSLGQRLAAHKVAALTNPFGTVFQPLAAAMLLRAAAGEDVDWQQHLVEARGRWQSYDLHGSIGAETPVELLQRISELTYNVGTFVRSADVLVLTLGTAWAYRLRQTGELVNNCHKQSADLFVKELLTPDEIINSLAETHAYLRRLNPKLRFVLTISPVRHLKDTLPLNAVSKSVLRVACHILSEMLPDVAYFPAYELLTDDLRDYRFYGADMLHPTPVAEDYVWDKFATAYFDADFGQFRREWGAVRQGLAHRPLYAGAPEHRQFLESLRERLQRLAGQRVPVGDELREVEQRLAALPQPRVAVEEVEDDGEERIDIGTPDAAALARPDRKAPAPASVNAQPDRQAERQLNRRAEQQPVVEPEAQPERQPAPALPKELSPDPLGLRPITPAADAAPVPLGTAKVADAGPAEAADAAVSRSERLSPEEFRSQRDARGRGRGGRNRGRDREQSDAETASADAASAENPDDQAARPLQEQPDREGRRGGHGRGDGRDRNGRRNQPESQPDGVRTATESGAHPVVLVTETQPALTEAEIDKVLDTAAALETAALDRRDDETATGSLDPAPKKKKRRSRGGAKRTARKHAARLAEEQEAIGNGLDNDGEDVASNLADTPVSAEAPTFSEAVAPVSEEQPEAPAPEGDARPDRRGGKKSSVITKSQPVKRGRRPLYNELAPTSATAADAAPGEVQPDNAQPSVAAATAASVVATAAIPQQEATVKEQPATLTRPVMQPEEQAATPHVPDIHLEAHPEAPAAEPAKPKTRSRAPKAAKPITEAMAAPAKPVATKPAVATDTDAAKPVTSAKPARKPAAAKKAAPKATPATGPETGSATTDRQTAVPAKKPAIKKAPAKPKASPPLPVADTTPAAEEKPAATPPAAKKAVATKAPAKKAPAKKATVKKAVPTKSKKASQ